MPPKLQTFHFQEGYRLQLIFRDGTEAEIDLEPYLWGEVFEPLRNHFLFYRAKLDEELGTLTWPNGADFAPEFLWEKAHESRKVAVLS